MTPDREHAHAHETPDVASHDDDLAPGHSNRAARLVAPTRPLVSGLIRRKADGNSVATGAEHAIATAASSSAHALPEPVLHKFESALGVDLSGVRVHTGAESQAAARSVGARAYTVGQDIHFAAGTYDPRSRAGEHLLAHEVAHTVQQRDAAPTRQNQLEVSSPSDGFEHDADRAADAMVAGEPARVTATSGGVARLKDLSDAADGGEATMDDVVRDPQVATTHVTNVEDKAAASQLLNIIHGADQDIAAGVNQKQIDESTRIANQQCVELLAAYLQAAEGQTAQISTFQGMFGLWLKDFGRLNGMMKSFDGLDLGTLKDPAAAGKQGSDQAKEIFHGEDAKKETARIEHLDPTIQTKLKDLNLKKQQIPQLGAQVIDKSNDVANALTGLSNQQRAFLAQANGITSPEAQKELQAAKARAQNDYSAAAGQVVKDALIGAVKAAPGGPGAAATAGAKAAGESVWSNVVKPKIQQALENADISVGKFPDNSAEGNKYASEQGQWGELQAKASAIVNQKNIVLQKADALGNQFEMYKNLRDLYENEMILLGQEMDKLAKVGQGAKPKDPCICDPNAKPPPPPPNKGPRYETVMQFLAEADRFTGQAEVLKQQGTTELKVTATGTNSASQAHANLVKATTSGERPNFYYTVNRMTVTRSDGSTWIKLTALRNTFTVRSGLNPGQAIDGGPAEDGHYGSAEGKNGFGANDAIQAALAQVDSAKAKIAAYRQSLASSVGLT